MYILDMYPFTNPPLFTWKLMLFVLIADGKLRSVIIGNDEYITKAPKRICLQAICMERSHSTQEILNAMKSLEEIGEEIPQ